MPERAKARRKPAAAKARAGAPRAPRRAPAARKRRPKRAPAGRAGAALTVIQIRSGIGCPERQRAVLRSLGLRGPHDRRSLPDHPSVRGMVAAIPHLVRIEEPAGRAGSKP